MTRFSSCSFSSASLFAIVLFISVILWIFCCLVLFVTDGCSFWSSSFCLCSVRCLTSSCSLLFVLLALYLGTFTLITLIAASHIALVKASETL